RMLQDRLPKDLNLAGITTIEAANRYLEDTYLATHNARFADAPAEQGSAFVPVSEAQCRDVLAIQEERTVAPDNTVAWKRQRLQIPPHPARAHFVRAKVRVHEYRTASSPSSTGRAAWCAGGRTIVSNQNNHY